MTKYQLFTRPPTIEVLHLQAVRIVQVANPLDNLWAGARDFDSRSFLPNQDNEILGLSEGTLTYWPKYPDDWIKHEAVHRVLELVHYTTVGYKHTLAIKPKLAYKYFFVVHASWRPHLLSGKKTERDLELSFREGYSAT